MNPLLAYLVRILAGVSAEEWRWILSVLAIAAKNFQGSDDKRGWVLTQLKGKFPKMGKSLANWVLESALLYLKAKGAQT